jgi:serine/threonine protein kinase
MSETAPISGDTRDRRIGEALNAYLDRRKLGTAEPEAEFLARHPDLADDLRLHLVMLGELQPVTPRIDALIARGVLRKSADPGYAAELGPYQIVRLLGVGAMGVVLLAHEERLRRSVALKILRPELAADAAALTRFTREARAAAALHHPHLVTVHTVGEEQGVHFMAMEYVDGPTLAEVIRAEEGKGQEAGGKSEAGDTRRSTQHYRSEAQIPMRRGALSTRPTATSHPTLTGTQHSYALPPDLIRELFRQLLTGLAAAHGAGLIHRDIKPSNILLDLGLQIADCGLQDRTASDREPAPHAPTGWPTSSEAGERWEGGPLVRKPGSAAAQPNPQTEIRDSQSAQHSALRTQHFSVKIADFGLARMLNAQTRVTLPAAVLGTPEYMSPEQARGESADHPIDHRADLYAAGVVLYEMLTGRTPFRGDSSSVVLHRILHEEPAHPRTLTQAADPHLASLALRLMAKRPEDRFASAAEALAALEAGGRVVQPARRRRRRRFFVSTLVVLVGVAGAAWLLRDAVGRRQISAVWVDEQDAQKCTVVQVRYADAPAYAPLVELPGAGVVQATLADVDGHRNPCVAAGTHRPLPRGCLFLFDEHAQEMRSWALTSARRWRDDVSPASYGCMAVAAGNLDGEPGDEIVAATMDTEQYATRLTILDPRTGQERAILWHLGPIERLIVSEDFWGQGRPAIVAFGKNHKLDGFGDPPPRPYRCPPGEYPPRTDWDVVQVLMIFDPRQLHGEQLLDVPPGGNLPRLPTVLPAAYAFLDRAERPPRQTLTADGRLRVATAQEVATITELKLWPQPDAFGARYVLKFGIEFPQAVGRGASVTVDSRLEPYRDPTHRDAFWQPYWHVIVQDSKYVDEAAERVTSPTPPP